jgi:hypothetical protein
MNALIKGKPLQGSAKRRLSKKRILRKPRCADDIDHITIPSRRQSSHPPQEPLS